MVSTFSEIMIPKGLQSSLLAPPPARHWDKKKPWVILLLGSQGTQISDLFASYSVFSASKAFNVATIALKKEPMPTTGRVFVYPDLTFDEAPSQIRLLIVPAVLDPGDPALIAATQKLSKRAFSTLVLSEGARLAAASGLLQGRRVTMAPMAEDDLRRNFSDVLWQKPQAWMQDGFIFSSAGLGLSLEASLYALLRIKPSAFSEATRRLGYPSRFQDADMPPLGVTSIGILDWVNIFYHAGFSFGGRDIAIPIFEGVDEIFTAAVLDTLTRTFSALPFPVSPQAGIYTSRYGMRLLAPHSIEDSPPPRTLIVPPTSLSIPRRFTQWATPRAEIRFFTNEVASNAFKRAAWIALDLTRTTSQGIVWFAVKSQNLTTLPLLAMTQEIPPIRNFLFWLRPVLIGLFGLCVVHLLRKRIMGAFKTTRSK